MNGEHDRPIEGRNISGLPREVLPDRAYHNKVCLQRPADGPFMARGVFGQIIYVDPEAQFAAVTLFSWPEFHGVVRAKTALAAIRAIRADLAGSRAGGQ
ncbi:MAG: hypothetical protein ACLQO1_22830 [Steroidobacteraceae bacterium]